jgi:hypothetical protein
MTPRSFSFLVLATWAFVQSSARAEALRGNDLFQKQVMPVLNEFCWDCHGDGMDKGKLSLDKDKDYPSLLANHKLWEDVREHVSTHVMPPDGKPAPTLEQRNAIVKWIDDAVFYVDPAKADPGHITLRRLNRVEYNNTVRDIFKIESRPADNFPPDDTGYGFDNIGDVLSLSPLLMEKFMRAARKVSDEALWTKPPERPNVERQHSQFWIAKGTGDVHGTLAELFSNGELDTQFDVQTEGVYRLTPYLTAEQCGKEKAAFAIGVDDHEVMHGEVTEEFNRENPEGNLERFAVDVFLKPGSHKIKVAFLNDFGDPNEPNPKRRDRNLYLQSMNIAGPIGFQTGTQSKFLDWLLEGKKLNAPTLSLTGEDFNKGEGVSNIYEEQAELPSEGDVHREVSIPVEGEYRIRISASEDHAGNEGAKMGVKLGSLDLGKHEITATKGKTQWVSIRKKLPAGNLDMRVSFLNDLYVEKTKEDRNLHLHRVFIEGPLSQAADLTGTENIKNWVSKLALKIFRKPLDASEINKLCALADAALKDGASQTEAVGLICEASLSSPKFLFRGGAEPTGEEKNGSVLIDEFTLASRLSYFIWSSAPDDELLQLASKGELRKNLANQVTRMIGDWKGWAMAEDFAGQWLQLRDVELSEPNRKLFPEMQGGMASLMKRESQFFFDHILRSNRSVLDFLDSDYSFMNEKLAKFYGIPNVKGKEFKKVSLAGTPRGGVLTQGSILLLTSHPNRTSPVKRGKFVLEQILGTPPPPPPQNVPAFNEDRGAARKGTLRQRFEAHRANPSCAACHAFLDPIGFAFEHYDAIGRYRDKDNGEQIDSTGKLISGQQFDNAETLRKLMVTDMKKDFIRCLTENLMIYSLGRGLDYTDKPAKDEIMAKAEKSGYKFQDMILAVCESLPFQKMRVEDVKKVVTK